MGGGVLAPASALQEAVDLPALGYFTSSPALTPLTPFHKTREVRVAVTTETLRVSVSLLFPDLPPRTPRDG